MNRITIDKTKAGFLVTTSRFNHADQEQVLTCQVYGRQHYCYGREEKVLDVISGFLNLLRPRTN